MLIGWVFGLIVFLPAILILFSSLAPLPSRIGWALLSIVPFALSSAVVYWSASAQSNQFDAANAVVDVMGNLGFLVAMFIGSWFVYLKFLTEYKQ